MYVAAGGQSVTESSCPRDCEDGEVLDEAMVSQLSAAVEAATAKLASLFSVDPVEDVIDYSSSSA